ncbi:MAG: hydrolase, alpha/beta fold family protein [Frankiales bacterium]|nr:hydrolase, alpha/beta fold family protein [Frankiales bacterium]
MRTFLLLHGAGSDGWYWHRVLPLLPVAIAPDLPVTDESCDFEAYADAAAAAVVGPVTVVAQSLSGFVAPLLVSRLEVEQILLVNAMVPAPGESAGDWWAVTGHAMPQGGPEDIFLHDVPPDVVAAGEGHVFAQAGGVFEKPWPLAAWPAVPTRALVSREDRFFPAEFQRRVLRDRLGLVPYEIDGGHLPALARPEELAAWLLT